MGKIWLLISLAKEIFGAVTKLAALFQEHMAKRQAEKEKAKIQAQIEIYKQANEIENDDARIKAKADALAKLDLDN